MQIESGEEDKTEEADPADDKNMDLEDEEMEDAPSVEKDFVNKTSPTRRNIENVECKRQDKVVGDTNAVGSEDYLGHVTSIRLQQCSSS